MNEDGKKETSINSFTEKELNLNCEGVPEKFHPVIKTHGRELFNFVMSVGLAQHALGIITAQAHKHHSKQLMGAGAMIGDSFNSMANQLGPLLGYTAELVTMVDRDIQMAAREEGPRIQLIQ